MLKETEIKLKLGSRKEAWKLIEKLEALSGGKFDFEEQRDEYYDNAKGDISNNDLVFRLRILNGRPVVGLKSPRVFLKDDVHQRVELEFEAASEAEVRKKIKRQKLRPVAIIEKRRWEFKLEGLKIAVDELPYVGWLVEIEGKNVSAINGAIERLKLQNLKREKGNNGDLLDAKMGKLGLPVRPNLRAVFNDKK